MDESIAYYGNPHHYKLWIANENRDITGGITTLEDIDRLREYPDVDTVCIMGLKQDTFEYFLTNYGERFRAILFFKNKFITDLSPLGQLESIEYLSFFHNQRVEKLWDMTTNEALKGLSIEDFSRLHTLDEIGSAPNLEVLHFGNAVWPLSVWESLKPLAGTRLKSLSFDLKKILDGDVTPLAQISTLERLDFSANLFTTEQIAWLKAKLPQAEGYALRPTIQFEKNEGMGDKDTLICGKGKPFLNSVKNHERIQKYTEYFNTLVEQYQKK